MRAIFLFVFLCFFSRAIVADSLDDYEKIFSRVKSEQKKETSSDEKYAVDFTDLKVGKADLGLLFLLHPKMQDYNFEVDSFVEPVKETVVDPRFLMKERQEKYQKIRKEVQRYSRDIQEQIRSLEQGLMAAKASFVQDVNRAYEEEKKNLQKTQKKVTAIEESYFRKRSEMEKKIQDLKDDYQKWRKTKVQGNFLDSEARDRKFDQIISEMNSLLEEEKKIRGLTFFVHSSLKKKAFEGLPLDPSFQNLTSAANYRNEYYLLTQNQIFLGEGGRQPSVEAELQAVSTYLNHYGAVHVFFSPLMEENPLIARYEQLTFDLLKKLWDRYQIPQSKQGKILSAISQWLKAKE